MELPDLIDFAITKRISQSMMYNVQKNMFVPILKTKQDIDQFAGDIESILVAAAKSSTPQENHVCSIKFNKTSRDIELLVLEKRRHRKEWQEHRSPGARSKLKAASRRLNNPENDYRAPNVCSNANLLALQRNY